MARVILSAYAIRFPVGGYLSWVLQWMLGFHELGHEVFFFEKSGWPQSCCHPVTGQVSNDCTPGTTALRALLARFGLEHRWSFVDAAGTYHGLSRSRVEETFRSADVFIDMGNTHGEWLDEASAAVTRVFVDGDPGFTQIKTLLHGENLDGYDYYYSVGRNVGTPVASVPTLGKRWRPIFDPVVPA